MSRLASLPSRCIRLFMVPVLGAGMMGAAPSGAPSAGFLTTAPGQTFRVSPQRLDPSAPATGPSSTYDAAPVPNQDAYAPVVRPDQQTSVSPNLFNRKDQYRGEALTPSTSTQSQQERRVTPGAGFSLRVPLQ